MSHTKAVDAMFNGTVCESRQDNCRGDVRATDLQNCEKPYQRLIRNRCNSELDHEYGDLGLSVLQSVGNREGQTRVNDTGTADSIQLESRTRPDPNYVDCSESEYNTIGAVTIDANSSYTHPAHRRVCMIVVVAVVCMMLAGSIAAGIIIAKQSLARASNTETSVQCSTNGSGKEKPNCIIPGSVSFSESEYVFHFGEDGILICRVDHYPQWQHVRIIKETPDANLTLFDISNETGVIESSSFIQNASYKLHNDGLTIELKFNPVNCSDDGTYYGLLIVGDIVNDVVANTTVHIKAELSSPQIVVPEQILVSREFVVTCTGYVGRNSNGTYGLISLEKRTNGNGDFTTEGVGNDSAGCDGKTFVTTNVTTNRAVRNLGFRCKIEGPKGITMYSDVINRTVIHSFSANITGYRLSSNGIPSDGLLEVNIPGFCEWSPVMYNVLSNYYRHDYLDVLICQHFGYIDESFIQPTSNQGAYKEACMKIIDCGYINMSTIYDIGKCNIEYALPFTGSLGNTYKEINCVPALLMDGPSKLQGRVIAGLFGQLQSICSLGFDARAANVICASLGYKRGATQLWRHSVFGPGSLPIYRRNITCSGDELSLELCNHSTTDIPGCGRSNVVAVKCQGDIIKIQPQFESRPYEGILEGYHGDLRYAITGAVSNNTAKTLCAMLGYGHVGFTQRAINRWNLFYYMDNVVCSGNEMSISECQGDLKYCIRPPYDGCLHWTFTYVALFCSDYKLQNLRLGPDGILLMQVNGRLWASCTEDFTEQTANAACRIMGYIGKASFSGQHSSKNGVEILGSLLCYANATSIDGCHLQHQFFYWHMYHIANACKEHILLTCDSSHVPQ